jgi:hypothetical protein
VLAAGVPGVFLCGEIPGAYRRERFRGQQSLSTPRGISRAKPLAS